MGGIFKRKKSRPAPVADAVKPATAAAKQTESDEEAALDTTSTMLGKKKKTGKKALITQPAAANVGGTGQSGLNIPKG